MSPSEPSPSDDRAHEAVRVLALRDTDEDPARPFSQALSERVQRLPDLVRFAQEHPDLTAHQLADFVRFADAMQHDIDAEGIARARSALRHPSRPRPLP